jgi:hypothetical protein
MTSKIIAEMTGREVLDAMSADSPLARVRTVLLEIYGEMVRADRQRGITDLIENRRMELQAANRILELFGIALS